MIDNQTLERLVDEMTGGTFDPLSYQTVLDHPTLPLRLRAGSPIADRWSERTECVLSGSGWRYSFRAIKTFNVFEQDNVNLTGNYARFEEDMTLVTLCL
jgi:hypothetical protein